MLKHLHIKDFALIDELDVDFYKGFSVITGETGAGKSIILGALGLLLGNRADSKTIKEGASRCIIEATFSIGAYNMNAFFDENDIDYDSEDCILRREVAASGKSRAFINDTPVTLNVLRELGEQLVDIHSQHQNLLLQKTDFQLSVVDIIAKDKAELTAYQQGFSHLKELRNRLNDLKDEIERNRSNADFLRFQYEELSAMKLQEGEQEELEQRENVMRHAEDIKTVLFEADSFMEEEENGILTRLRRINNGISGITKVYPELEELSDRIDQTFIEMKDIAAEIADKLEEVEFDPDELDKINDRLDGIYTLQKKHHVDTVEELISLKEHFKELIDGIENSDESLKDLQDEVDKQKAEVQALAQRLTKQRQKSAAAIQKDIISRLKPLGLENVRFEIAITEKELSDDGCDAVQFLFSANPGSPLHPISDIASGGEIARVMLSLKAMLSGAVKLPTIIFDEIDTGVSGRVAEQMAKIMKEMGDAERQVISITHLPQIAASGSNHYKVQKTQTKETTRTSMVHLNDDQRVEEVAQMLSGSNITEAAISNARALLSNS